MKLSIIIPNYNYGNYLGAAIDSALALDWPDKEIIVADDGSTDNSHAVMRSYGAKVIPLLLPNGGQNSACNAGYEHCSGDIIIFLDSDDILYPSVADTLRSSWSNRVSKLQWSLALTDEQLRPLGPCDPIYWRGKPTPEQVRQTLHKTGNYPFSTIGAWARNFLRQVYPAPVRRGSPRGGCNGDYRLPNNDYYLSMLAPFFGDVVCISHRQPQGAYRLHGHNDRVGAQSFEHYAEAAMQPFECARVVNSVLNGLNIEHIPIDPERDENTMKRQLVCARLKLDPRRCSKLSEALRKYWHSIGLSDAPMTQKVKWWIWGLLVAGAPRPISVWAIGKRRKVP